MNVLDSVAAILKQKGGQTWSITPSATVYEALEMMASREVGALLVMENDRVAGLLSERDYARKIILKGLSSRDTTVEEIMVSPAITIPADCSVTQAMKMMTDNRVRHLPVVGKDGRPLGMISIGDLIKWTITSQEETIEQLHSYIAGQS